MFGPFPVRGPGVRKVNVTGRLPVPTRADDPSRPDPPGSGVHHQLPPFLCICLDYSGKVAEGRDYFRNLRPET